MNRKHFIKTFQSNQEELAQHQDYAAFHMQELLEHCQKPVYFMDVDGVERILPSPPPFSSQKEASAYYGERVYTFLLETEQRLLRPALSRRVREELEFNYVYWLGELSVLD